MSNVMMKTLGLGALFAVVGLVSARSDAQSCSSDTTCARTLACPVGYTLTSTGSAWTCKDDVPGASVNPTCGSHNLANDWTWDSAMKQCRRTKSNGDKVYSSENRECASGYTYSASSGKCEKPAQTKYTLPILSTTSGAVGIPPVATYSSATAADRTLACPSGYDKVNMTPGPKAYCKKVTSGATATPTCGSHNLANDWVWDAGQKKCRRTRDNGDKVYSTENIKCASDFDYKSSSGLCEKPGGTYYSTPVLQ